MSNIAIIGSGQIGSALTRLFTQAGHHVAVANSRGPASLQQLAQDTGARAVSAAEAVHGDIVVVAVPIGFDAVDAGTIAQSWRQQPGSPGYLKDGNADGVRQSLSEAAEARTPQWRATPDSPGTFASPA